MEVFEKDSKINFVDANNVFVGFDNIQSCCEDFGWYYSKKVPAKNKRYYEDNLPNDLKETFDPKGWFFDTSFAKTMSLTKNIMAYII